MDRSKFLIVSLLALGGCFQQNPKPVCPTYFHYTAEDQDMLLQEMNGSGDHQVERRFMRDYGKVRVSEKVLCPEITKEKKAPAQEKSSDGTS